MFACSCFIHAGHTACQARPEAEKEPGPGSRPKDTGIRKMSGAWFLAYGPWSQVHKRGFEVDLLLAPSSHSEKQEGEGQEQGFG